VVVHPKRVPPGIYFVRVTAGAEIISAKFIILGTDDLS
jgi:hypothetical protein